MHFREFVYLMMEAGKSRICSRLSGWRSRRSYGTDEVYWKTFLLLRKVSL
jgi:hypothetical protein